MDEHEAVRQLLLKAQDYAEGRITNIARGAETPRLAALLVQKYGLRLADAASAIFDTHAGDAVLKRVDELTEQIDPDWRAHDRERWEGRPADVVPHG